MTELKEKLRRFKHLSEQAARHIEYAADSQEEGFEDAIPASVALYFLNELAQTMRDIESELTDAEEVSI